MNCPINYQTDPFKKARDSEGVFVNEFDHASIPMILSHKDVRAAAKDWQTYSSDAPFKVPIPTEEDVRTVRQLPLEVDPPIQQAYREVVEPFFKRAKLPEIVAKMDALVCELVKEAMTRESFEVVRDFAIPLQSRALAILLNMPDKEAQIWIGWGTHVFREGDGTSKGAFLEAYVNGLLDDGAAIQSESFFSEITRAEFQGRRLTREEMLGFCSIMFAGGRDTVINSITAIMAHLSHKLGDLDFLREDPKRIIGASEEFFRVISPVTHLARKCPHGANVHGVVVNPGEFVSLCFSSANYDSTVFDAPEEIRLNRSPNPHVAFGFGPHLCLGAAHARLVVRSLLRTLCEHVGRLDILEEEVKNECETSYMRRLAFDRISMRLHSLSPAP